MTLGPYARLLDISVEASADAPVLLMPFAEDVVGRPGFLHGGAIAGLLELAAAAALRQALGRENRFEQVNVTVDYLRGGRDKPTRAVGRVARLGARVANVEACAWQDDADKPIASARLTYLIAPE